MLHDFIVNVESQEVFFHVQEAFTASKEIVSHCERERERETKWKIITDIMPHASLL